MSDKHNGCIRLASGRLFEVFGEHQLGEIDPFDIAHALSNVCRFAGHTIDFYSVAQHCVHVAEWLPDELKLWGLMHDAAEAYIGDVVGPIKKAFSVRVRVGLAWELNALTACEDRLLQTIAQRFGLSWPMPSAVKEMDRRFLVTEMRDLTRHHGGWQAEADAYGVKPLDIRITPWAPARARKAFMSAFERYLQIVPEGVIR